LHIPTHILSGWVVANLPLFAARFSPRERLFCMIAAGVADFDGVGFFFGEEVYWRFHHVLGHNVFFGLAISVAMAAFSGPRLLAFVAYLALFHLHLLLDYYGSGIGWKIHYLWPIDERGFKTDDAWPLSSWQNYLAFVALAVSTAGIAWRKRRSPLELLLPRFEAKFFSPTAENPSPLAPD
jgi:inner membrane protein